MIRGGNDVEDRDVLLSDVAVTLVPAAEGPPVAIVNTQRIRVSEAGVGKIVREAMGEAQRRFDLDVRSVESQLRDGSADVRVKVKKFMMAAELGVTVELTATPQGRLRIRIADLRAPAGLPVAGLVDRFLETLGSRPGVYPVGQRTVEVDANEVLASRGLPVRLEQGVREARITPGFVEIA
ncbi:MAG: hypothetical protein M3Q71_10485 [Chloroflexota bacterium]|nr:hypothetical protein [Chloroflexota bacterium]MDP9471077.1 hypothetical protein [Chloroflexota bacterium]